MSLELVLLVPSYEPRFFVGEVSKNTWFEAAGRNTWLLFPRAAFVPATPVARRAARARSRCPPAPPRRSSRPWRWRRRASSARRSRPTRRVLARRHRPTRSTRIRRRRSCPWRRSPRPRPAALSWSPVRRAAPTTPPSAHARRRAAAGSTATTPPRARSAASPSSARARRARRGRTATPAIPSTPLTACAPCPVGASNPRLGQSACIPCSNQGDDKYANASGSATCASCPANTHQLTGDDVEAVGVRVDACACRPGFYDPVANRTGVACVPCPKGATCAGDLARPASLPVYFGCAPPNDLFFMRCHRMINNESPCPAGLCQEGFEGMSCSRCKRGYYRFQRQCVECGAGARGGWCSRTSGS